MNKKNIEINNGDGTIAKMNGQDYYLTFKYGEQPLIVYYLGRTYHTMGVRLQISPGQKSIFIKDQMFRIRKMDKNKIVLRPVKKFRMRNPNIRTYALVILFIMIIALLICVSHEQIINRCHEVIYKIVSGVRGLGHIH